MKKRIQIAVNVLCVLMSLFIGISAWVYCHPHKELNPMFSEGVQLPEVGFTPRCHWFAVPPKLAEQRDEFNTGISVFYNKKIERYPKDLKISYDLDRQDGGGVIVTLYGSGTTKDGKKEEFKEKLEFSITVKDNTKVQF
ncbi:hypothetical protein [Emergencia sp.]|uniref:hypothetical protein n=1 Tax=Emergencia sp. TaxID=1926557 RepID=UPI003AEFDB47